MCSSKLVTDSTVVRKLADELSRASAIGPAASLGAATGVLAAEVGASAATLWELAPDRPPELVCSWPDRDGVEGAGPGAGILEDPRLAAGEVLGPDPDGWLLLPLRARDALVGALALATPADPSFSPADFEAATGVLAGGLVLVRTADRSAKSARDARAMLDDIGAVIVRVGADGRLTFVNQAWTALTGITYENVIGKDAMHHVHPDDRALAAQHLGAMINGSSDPYEIRFLAQDGSPRWMEVIGQALFDDSGAVAGFAGILHDVTDRRRAELAEREARSRAEDAQQLAERASRAKSDFLSRMSHELRTPLNAIIGFTELLESDELPQWHRDSVNQISVAGRHLLDLVSEALDVARIESGQMPLRLTAVPVAPLVAECLGMMRPAAESNRIALHGIPEEHAGLWVLGDVQRLRQVLLNLLSNAVKYSGRDGRVTVDCFTLDLEAPTGVEAAHGWVRITVADRGPGIPPDRLGDVFLPFERLGAERSEIPGTGLGLALTRGVVEAMGGRINVSSVPGVGATFQVDLPAAAADEAPADPGAPAADRVSG